MKMLLPMLFAARYVFSRRDQRFISFVSLVSWLGLILGVTVMIVVTSVMNGFDRELKQRILKVIPHGSITIKSEAPWSDGTNVDWQKIADSLLTVDEIEAVSPVIDQQVLISAFGNIQTVELQGILPSREVAVSEIDDSMLAGQLDNLKPDNYGIILGRMLANRLQVTVGDQVTVILPDLVMTPAGIYPRQKKFTVQGVFYVGAMPDATVALTHIESSARLLKQLKSNGTARVEKMRVKTADIHRADSILDLAYIQTKGEVLPDVTVSSWKDTHSTLFGAVKMERRVVTLLLFIVIVVAVFNIASTLVMMVSEKRSDIAILKVMGARNRQIVQLFVTQGLLIGFMGILIGVVTGSLIAINLDVIIGFIESLTHRSGLFDGDIYYITHLPSYYQVADVVLITVASLVLCIAAATYPSLQASRIDPVSSLNS